MRGLPARKSRKAGSRPKSSESLTVASLSALMRKLRINAWPLTMPQAITPAYLVVNRNLFPGWSDQEIVALYHQRMKKVARKLKRAK